MFPLRRRTLSFALAALLGAANALAACGDGGNEDGRPLSSATASQLQATLDEIEQTAANGDCEGAGDQAARLAQQVSSLPAGVNADLRDALTSGANRLQSLLDRQCKPAAPATAPPPTEPEPQPQETDEQEDKQKKPKKPKEEQPQDEQQGGDQQQDGGGEGENGSADGGSGQGTGGVTP
jgi:outer membrane biosynthesis protein TonB